MTNKHDSLTAEIISAFDQASAFLSDCYYADEESELWFCRWRSRDFEAGSQVVESLMPGDVFVGEDARRSVRESLDWYRHFLEQRGYDFICVKLTSLIERVAKADIAVA
jgi:hypothetical protein